MRVLVACEFSGTVRDAFTALGHEAWSCDLLPTESEGNHYQGDVLEFIKYVDAQWDLMIAHPPCTYLSVSGLHWNKRVPGRAKLTEDALDFVRQLMNAPIDKICIENPVSCISSRIRKPDQIIQPWWFGDDASKKTCLWLKNLPLLVPTNKLPGNDKTRRANQTPSGQNKLGPSHDRWKIRSKTYQGIANAFALQWGLDGALATARRTSTLDLRTAHDAQSSDSGAPSNPHWQKVVFASELRACECCDEPYCDQCQSHYADCDCPGPTQDDLFEYREISGDLFARSKPEVA